MLPDIKPIVICHGVLLLGSSIIGVIFDADCVLICYCLLYLR